MQECADKTEAAKEQLNKAERWLRMAPTIETRLSAYRKELEARQENMAPVDKFKWFYNTMERFLAQHQVKLVDITREPEVGDAGVLPKFPYQAATFGVKLNAYFQDFGSFLAEFENQFPFMRVQNLELESEVGGRLGVTETIDQERKPAPGEARTQASERLAITMRVVTLVKPNGIL